MHINWYGLSCFKMETKEVTIVTDPFLGPKYGLRTPSLKADLVTISHQHPDHNNLAAVKAKEKGSEPFIISTPGEYEVKKVFIYGISSFHDKEKGTKRGLNTIFVFRVEDITIAHLGDLGHILTDEQLEKLEGVDILMIPVGGTYTITAKEAKEVISQVEPRLVIPMHYKIPGLKLPLDGVSKFCQEMGASESEAQDYLRIAKKDLIAEETKVILLKK